MTIEEKRKKVAEDAKLVEEKFIATRNLIHKTFNVHANIFI
jgi:hypothetical protein